MQELLFPFTENKSILKKQNKTKSSYLGFKNLKNPIFFHIFPVFLFIIINGKKLKSDLEPKCSLFFQYQLNELILPITTIFSHNLHMYVSIHTTHYSMCPSSLLFTVV